MFTILTHQTQCRLMFAVTIMLETQRSLTKEPCTATSWLTSNVAASLSPMQIHLVPGQT